MKFFNLLFILFQVFTFSALAQIQGDGGVPKSVQFSLHTTIQSVAMPVPDVNALRAEDQINDAQKLGPWRFGYKHETNLKMSNAGSWTSLANGGQIWQLRVECPNALTVNLLLKDVVIPAGNELFVYNADGSMVLGKFTQNHLYEGQLGTELLTGDRAIIEYYVAPHNMNAARSLTIEGVTHGYRTAKEYQTKAFGGSGSCNMNVNCPDGANWENQKRSVVMLVTNGSGFCTGATINNALNDGKPYVLSANHCYSNNVASWVFRFHWESATCANPATSPTFQSLSGSVLRARRTPTDFLLVEITGGLSGGTIPQNFNPYFSGYDKSGNIPTTTVGIHHPAGDIKKISFDDNPASAVQAMGSTEANSSWAVSWDRNTTTEGGSSGSPLFNQDGNIIGQLWGGGASCSNLSAPDYYGRVSVSWNPAGSNSTNQLQYWLDPNNGNSNSVPGYDPYAVVVANDASILSIDSPIGTQCNLNLTPSVTLKNNGTVALTSVVINYQLNGGTAQSFTWTGNLASNGITAVAIPAITAANGANSLLVGTSLPNNVADENPVNDSKTVSFNAVANAVPVTVTIRTDCYGREVYWRIVNQSNAVVLSGGNPTVVLPGGTNGATNHSEAYGNAQVIVVESCLPEACYTFEMYDDYGDGLNYASGWNCSAPNAGFSVVSNNQTLVTNPTNLNFGAMNSTNFCLGETISSPCDNAAVMNVSTNTTASNGSNGTATTTVTGGVSPYTYSYTGPNGFSGTTQSLSGLAPGSYSVTVTDACGTVVTRPFNIVSSLGLDLVGNAQVFIYPNPSQGNFTLEFTENIGEYSVAVVDITGRAVYNSTDASMQKKIELTGVAAGKYVVQINSPLGTSHRSIVIQ